MRKGWLWPALVVVVVVVALAPRSNQPLAADAPPTYQQFLPVAGKHMLWPGHIYTYRLPERTGFGVTFGPDGALYLAGSMITRFARDGTFSQTELPSRGGCYDLAFGVDGALWCSDNNNNVVVRRAVTGQVSEIDMVTLRRPRALILAPNGDIWVGGDNGYGRITQDGDFTPFPVSTGEQPSTVGDFAIGADGAVWATFPQRNMIGRIAPDGTLTPFTTPGNLVGPTWITSGADGALWFTAEGRLGRLTRDGHVTAYELPWQPRYFPGLGATRDGSIWFATANFPQLGRITPTGSVEFSSAQPGSSVWRLLIGPDDSPWFILDDGAAVGVLKSDDPATPRPTPTVSVTPHPSRTPTPTPTPTPAVAITEFPIPATVSNPMGIAAGPDEVWVSDQYLKGVWRLLPSGAMTPIPLPTPALPGGLLPEANGGLYVAVGELDTVAHRLPTGAWRTFDIPADSRGVGALARGPDGAVWYLKWQGGRVGRLTADGATSEYILPGADTYPNSLVVGPDRALWLAHTRGIGRLTLDGAYNEYAVTGGAFGIRSGPDGALWFYQPSRLGRITVEGEVTLFPPLPLPMLINGLTSGPGGAIWFTSGMTNQIGRFTPPDALNLYHTPTERTFPEDITWGADGALWFTEDYSGGVGRLMPEGWQTGMTPTPTATLWPFTTPTPQATLARPPHFEGFTTGSAGEEPTDVAVGPDGAIWFTQFFTNYVGRLAPDGRLTEFPIPVPDSGPRYITAGPDGAVWFVLWQAGKVGRLTPQGDFSVFTPVAGATNYFDITTGPDGNLWLTELTGNQLVRLTPTGQATLFPLDGSGAQVPYRLVSGPDGALWGIRTDKVTRFTLDGHPTTTYTLPHDGSEGEITVGPDGAFWISGPMAYDPSAWGIPIVARCTLSGKITEFRFPHGENGVRGAFGITAGPDGAIWFADPLGRQLVRLALTSEVQSFRLPWPNSAPVQVVVGPDGGIWFTSGGQYNIGRLALK